MKVNQNNLENKGDVEIRITSKGKSIFATRNLYAGEVILIESPLVSQQQISKSVKVFLFDLLS